MWSLALPADGAELFCADSESSSVRAVNLRTGGSRLCAGGTPLLQRTSLRYAPPGLDRSACTKIPESAHTPPLVTAPPI